MEVIESFFHKMFNLTIHLADYHSGNIFALDTIETTNNVEESLVFFINTKTGEHLSKSLKELFNNKNILKYFNNVDASQIGYTYGRLTTIARLSDEN